MVAADVVDSRLELAKKMGATDTINSKEKNLKDEVMRLTNGNGIARLVEASGFPPVVNSCFSMLRKVIFEKKRLKIRIRKSIQKSELLIFTK